MGEEKENISKFPAAWDFFKSVIFRNILSDLWKIKALVGKLQIPLFASGNTGPMKNQI